MRWVLVGVALVLVIVGAAAVVLRPRGNPFVPSFEVTVRHHLGVAAAERELAVPLERAMSGIPEISSMRTRIDAQQVLLTVELLPGKDPALPTQEALSAVSKVQLPGELTADFRSHREPTQRVYIGLESEALALAELQRAAWETVATTLLREPGYRSVTECGPGAMGLVVTIDPARTPSGPVDVLRALQALQPTHQTSPSLVRTGSVTMAELEQAVVGPEGLRLRDVATLSREPLGPACTEVFGGRGVGLLVEFAAETSPSAVTRALAALPAGIKAHTLRVDQVMNLWGESDSTAALHALPGGGAFELSTARQLTAIRAFSEVDPAHPSLLLPRTFQGSSLHPSRLEGPRLTEIEVLGPDLAALEKLAAGLGEKLAASGEVLIDLAPQQPLVEVELDHGALARLGLDALAVHEAIALASEEGYPLPLRADSQLEVRLRLPPSKSGPLPDVPLAGGRKLSEVARVSRALEPAWIDRVNQQRAVRLQTALTPALVNTLLKELPLPVGYQVRVH